ncbi:MAG: GNAT family N-acetyltransferase [Chloroflexota bacterium]
MIDSKSEIRSLTVEDSLQCLALSQAVGWKHDNARWQQMIQLGGDGAFGLTIGDELVATVIATVYNPDLAWIGLVLTHPNYQRRGFGKQIMQITMNYLHDLQIRCLMLDATVYGYSLYEQLGFRSVYQLGVWTRESTASNALNGAPASTIRPMLEKDLPSVVALDAQIFGVSRPHVLRDQQGVAWVALEAGEVVGYLLGKITDHSAILGPWYHPSPDGAEALLQAVVSTIGDRPVRMDVVESNSHARDIVQRGGFAFQRYCTRMAYGDPIPGRMTDQYAIASFATG